MENYEKRIQWDPVMKTYKELKTFPDSSILIIFLSKLDIEYRAEIGSKKNKLYKIFRT